MYNPDFWEVQFDQSDLEMMPDDVGLWYESPGEQDARYDREDRVERLIPQIDTLLNRSLTQKQFEAAVLYFKYGKTQREISEIMGISRRVVSQHLFGITRNGKSVGGAVKKLRKLSRKHGIVITN